jgi:hypothetical protein
VPTKEGPYTKLATVIGVLALIATIVGISISARIGSDQASPPIGAGPSNSAAINQTALPSNGASGEPPVVITTVVMGNGGGQQAGGAGGGSGGNGGGSQPTSAPVSSSSQYLSASRFVAFGESYGPFFYDTAGTRLTISSTDDYIWERGGRLADASTCALTVDFDLRLEETTYPGDIPTGFGVMPRGHVQDDQPVGQVLYIQGLDDLYGHYATFESEPIPGRGAKGEDWVDIPDPRNELHVSVTMSGGSMSAVVGGVHISEDWGSGECGSLMFYTWGGATAHINNVRIT